MIQKPINPYEPSPLAKSIAAGESLAFQGTIEKSDYQEMLPRWDLERWLCFVLAILLAMCILVFGPISVLFAISGGHVAIAIGLVCFWMAMLAGLWFLKRRITSVDLANRMLHKFPDVLGPASGTLSDSGVTFNDGVRTYWFGFEIAQQAAIQQNGIRVAVDGSKYRYLALTSRLFDNYRAHAARRLQQHWAGCTPVDASDEAAFVRESWARVSKRPTDAVYFDGVVAVEQPLQAATPVKRLLSEVLIYGAAIILLINFRVYLEAWIFWLGVLAVGYSLLQSLLAWLPIHSRTVLHSWHQVGWISGTEFAICNKSAGVRMPLTDIQTIIAKDEASSLFLNSGAHYLIPRGSIATDDAWQRLQTLARELQATQLDQPRLSEHRKLEPKL